MPAFCTTSLRQSVNPAVQQRRWSARQSASHYTLSGLSVPTPNSQFASINCNLLKITPDTLLCAQRSFVGRLTVHVIHFDAISGRLWLWSSSQKILKGLNVFDPCSCQGFLLLCKGMVMFYLPRGTVFNSNDTLNCIERHCIHLPSRVCALTLD